MDRGQARTATWLHSYPDQIRQKLIVRKICPWIFQTTLQMVTYFEKLASKSVYLLTWHTRQENHSVLVEILNSLWFSLSLGPRPWWTFSRTWTMNKPTSKSPSKTFSVKMSANQGWRLCLVTQAETQTIQSLQIVKKNSRKWTSFVKRCVQCAV